MPPSLPQRTATLGIELERCIFCQGTKVRREGTRRKKHEVVQLWYCHDCERTFTPQRAKGRVDFDLDGVEIKAKRNHACRVADLVLQSVTHHKRRHDELQRFMLTTDWVTVAVELPIYLTREDVEDFRRKLGFKLPMEVATTLTGHIDLIQVRHGAIHIVDYKPKAKLEKPIAQLMIYALALSRRTGLKLFDFVCAWFDEHDYYEFYPLHVVHKRR